MVKGEDDKLLWQFLGNPEYEEYMKLNEDEQLRVNYQFMISGLGIRYTFLLNVNTGKTWQLVKDIDSDQLFWSPLQTDIGMLYDEIMSETNNTNE